MHCNLTTPITYYKSKWESVGIMDGSHGCWSHCHFIFRIWRNHQRCVKGRQFLPSHIWQHATIHMPNIIKMSSNDLGKKGEWTYCKQPYYVFQGQFTLWTSKSDQGVARVLSGCWTCPGTTSIYTKDKMAEGPYWSRSPKYNFQGLINALTWSNGFCSERGKRGGLVRKDMVSWQWNSVVILF